MSRPYRVLALAPLFLAAFVLQDLVRLPLVDAFRIWAYPESVEYTCPVSAALVMGAAQYDGEPSPVFERRLDLAYELYRQGCVDRIVVAGGRQEGDRYSEGEAGVDYLAEKGVPERALVAESNSRTSFENIRNSLPLIPGDSVLIVTDDMHAFRSRWLAERLGLQAEVAPVRTVDGRFAYGGRELLALLAYQSGLH